MTRTDESLGRFLPPEIAGEYEALALLKEGAERQTLLLQDRQSGEKRVLKRMLRPAGDAREKYARLSRLAGGGIPRIDRFFQSGGAAYLLREYVEGETLLDLVQKRGRLSAEETARIGIALCRTLDRLHRQQPPLIHRDIKAENVLRTPAGEYVLIDFDIARFYDGRDSRDTERRGSEFAAPPEQFGYRQTDPRSDIYALGVLLHELATGESRLNRGETPAALRAVVSKCTRFDPKDRYQSAAALEKALKRAADGAGRAPARALASLVGAALALGIALALAAAGRAARSGREGYAFQSPVIEAAVCRQLQKEPGTLTRSDLEAISSLLLCGDEPFERWEQMDTHGEEITLDALTRSTRGSVDTLEDLRAFPNLTELAVCNAQIEDVSPLVGSPVRRLALHGNRIADLSPLAECRQLQELIVSANPVSDLSPLSQCPALERINVGATGITNLAAAADMPSLNFLTVHDGQYLADVSALDAMEGLRYLSIRPANAETLARIGGIRRLEHLYVWVTDTGPHDLTALSGLTELTRLFVDMRAIESLEGLEGMTKLRYLDVRCSARLGTALDPAPLRGLMALEEVNVSFMDTRGLADILSSLPALRRVRCFASQRAALSELLDRRPDVEIAAF